MTGKATIIYNYDFKNGYEAHLMWEVNGEREGIWAYSQNSWEEARAMVIEKFKKVPPSEEIVV